LFALFIVVAGKLHPQVNQREASLELQGWKQIASYLGITERTAQNWFLYRAMPIHRLLGEKNRVFAKTVEIESWKVSSQIQTGRLLDRAVAVCLYDEELAKIHSLIPGKFASVQDFISQAIFSLTQGEDKPQDRH
jgi:hypothetical protein